MKLKFLLYIDLVGQIETGRFLPTMIKGDSISRFYLLILHIL
jgi:hypothetical protein